MPRLQKVFVTVLPALLLLAISFVALAAQTPGSAGPGQVGGLRAYWHVFIAYSIVIVVVLGWVISIGRRLKDIEKRMGE